MRLRERVVDAALHAVLGVHGQIAAVRQREQRGTRVIVLLQMAMQDRMLGGAGREIVDGHLHVAPIGITLVAIVAHGSHRSHDELAVVHDGPLVHEPRPRAVVVQLDRLAGHVIGREIRDSPPHQAR